MLAVYSGDNREYAENRTDAVDKLKNGSIRVIFSVDMFNEGVDIPAVDMVMFLRPTDSPVVFLQQLGRGLRKSKGKAFLNVIDFIGNYEKAGRVRFLLTENGITEKGQYDPSDKTAFPDDCMIDFDIKLIDLFAEMDKKGRKAKDLVREEYLRVKEILGKAPSRMELFTYMDDDVYQAIITRAKENPFKHYLDYQKEMGDLSADLEQVYNGIGNELISLIENTDMSKVYKMPVLMAFYNHGNVRMHVTEEQLLVSWKEFFSTGKNWRDLEKDITRERYCAITDKEHIRKIMNMPVHFLLESGKGFFVKEEGYALALRKEFESVISLPGFSEQMKDAIDYRVMNYYQRRYRGERSV